MKQPRPGALTPPPPMGSGPDSSVPAILKSAPVAASESPGVHAAHTPKY